MFEAAEVGHEVRKADYKKLEPELHTRLLAAQRRLREAPFPLIVVVSGVEGAGKGTVVNRLHTWLDARGMRTATFWDETDEERERPWFWRFWRELPPRGTIGVLFGSWYTRPIIDRVYGRTDDAELERQMGRIARFERMLVDDGALIVKLWFHLSKKAQRKRLEEDARPGGKGVRVSPLTKKFSKRYDEFVAVSERAIRDTDTGHSPWHIIEAADPRYRDLTAGNTILEALEARLDAHARRARGAAGRPRALAVPSAERTVLDTVDLSARLGEKAYDKALAKYQKRLNGLAWRAREARRHTVAVFEGWDAAGKGGAIRRLTAAIDARLYHVISVAAPTEEERAQHYLWRFWRHLPRAGYVTLYDRSWYGRVLVERVEGFARRAEWMRAYEEINDFEEQLTEHGIVLMKFWLHISPDEQLRRFEERQQVEWKQHKITEEDWRNREKWDEYEAAVNEMVARTSTTNAPWTIVPANDKRYARIEVLKTFCERIERVV